MNELFYIHANGNHEGPFDTIALLKRIRSGRLTADMLVTREGDDTPAAAGTWPQLASFFKEHGVKHQAPEMRSSAWGRFSQMLENGWRIVNIEPGLCAMAGGILLVSFIIMFTLASFIPLPAAGLISYFIFFTLQNTFIAVVLRLSRGQRLSTDYLTSVLTPVLPALIFASLAVSLLMMLGIGLLLIPGILLLMLFSFTPFMVADKNMHILPALQASAKLITKEPREGKIAFLFLNTLYVFSTFMILPLPFILPVYAAALAEHYDQMVSLEMHS